MTSHLTEEEMVDCYYTESDAAARAHLVLCPACSALFQNVVDVLDAANEATTPLRGPEYGAQVWFRVASQLPNHTPTRLNRHWILTAAAAAMVMLFFAGAMWLGKTPSQPSVALVQTQLPKPVNKVRVEPVPVAEPIRPKVARRIEKHSLTPKAAPRRVVGRSSDVERDAQLLTLNGLLEVDSKAALPEILDMVHNQTSDRTKEHALFVLAQSDSVEARHAVMRIAGQASDPSLQAKAVRLISMFGSDGERKQLAGLYQAAPNQVIKLEIQNGLTLSGVTAEALTDSPLEFSPVQGQSYGFKTPNAVKNQVLSSVFRAADTSVLLSVLKDEADVRMRVATIRSLAVIGEQGNVFSKIYRSDKNDEVRRAVLDALVVQKNSEALEELADQETNLTSRLEILKRVTRLRQDLKFK